MENPGHVVGRIGLVVSAFLLLCLQAYASDTLRPIRIGATVSLEGPYQSLSFMVRNGNELWAKEVNKRGGLLGRKVELVFYDDKSQEERVAPLYEQLITKDKVDLVLSPYGSTLSMAAAEVSEKYGYVLLAASASSTAIWTRDFKGVFGVYSTAERYFLGFLDLVARQGHKTVAVVYSSTIFNVSAAEGVHKWSSLFGLEVVFSEKFGHHEDELSAIVYRLAEKKIDSVIFCGYPPEGYHFIELLKKTALRPAGLALTIIPALPDFQARAGEFAEGIFGPSQWEADERLPFPGTLAFINNFVALTGKKPSYQACSSYSACQILERAILQAGEINHEKIRNFVSNLDTVTIMGRFKVDFDGKQIGHNPILVQWQNGNKEIVYPTKMRTSPAQFTYGIPGKP